MNSTIHTLLNHRSIRQFKSQNIGASMIEQLVNVARMASSSNHLQSTSIIRITDLAIREQLKDYSSNQQYVFYAQEFWVFCADFSRHKHICSDAELDYAEVLLIGTIDAGIMAQNVLVAAENLGLGGVYIGSLRNHIAQVGELLKLPQHCVPLFGLCLGYPDQNPPLKPRLPKELMFFENVHQALDETKLAEYNVSVADYYQQRSQIEMDWFTNVEKTLAKPVRPFVLNYLQKQGFIKK